jgi:lysylphosphatidylglycerol synthetase-like protein (DUF2156 family)
MIPFPEPCCTCIGRFKLIAGVVRENKHGANGVLVGVEEGAASPGMNKHAQAETGRGDVAKLGSDVRVDSEEFWLTGCHVEDIREAARAREESGEEIRKCKMEL